MSFIVKKQELDTELRNELSSGFFQSPEMFVKLYNEGLINKANDQVDIIARKIADAYKDVTLSGRNLNLLSVEEVAIGEIDTKLHYWKSFVALKREVERLTELGEMGAEENVAFSEDSLSDVGVVRRDDEDELVFVKIGTIRESFSRPLINRIGRQDPNTGYVYIMRSDIDNTDLSFIQDIWGLFPED